jgi:hypothetical protein
MKSWIIQTIKQHANHAVALISKNVAAWEWVLLNCDENAITNKEKIYTAITKEQILCPCGSGKHRYISGWNHIFFCDKGCRAAQASKTETNLKKYGVAHPSKLSSTTEKRRRTTIQRYGVDNPFKSAEIKEKIKETNLEKYGVEFITQASAIKDKIKETNLERFGVEHPMQNEEYRNMVRQSNLEKFGFEFPTQRPEIKKKICDTNLFRFGVEYPTQSPQILNKIKKTNIERYGVDNPFKSTEIKEKIKETNFEKYGEEYAAQSEEIKNKTKETNIKKYGVENVGQVKEFRDKSKKTNLEKYGVDNPLLSIEIQNRIHATNVEKYGGISPASSATVRQKMKDTMLRKYGVPFALQKHYSAYALEILNDKEKFSDLFKIYSLPEIINKLGVSETTIYVTHNKYGLNYISSKSSCYEHEINNWLSTFIEAEIKMHDRTICAPKEIDILIPSKNFAIEFNGNYWHSEYAGNKSHSYHYDKFKKCAEQNIQLLSIFEDEWCKKPDICKSIIKNSLGYGTRIYARKCSIEKIDNIDLKEFLDNNHLQGWVSGNSAFVMKYNNEIVAAMTFGRPRYNKTSEWELLRLVFKNDTIIIGGVEKLWKFMLSELQPKSIISYCDRRWFTGKVYAKLGFNKISNGKPIYWYTDYLTRWHRSKFTKKKLLKLSADPKLNPLNEDWSIYTESQITKNILNLDRIWDCGQDSWLWTSKEKQKGELID